MLAIAAAASSIAVVASVGACNSGIFAPTNAGPAVCECTCGTSLEPDAGDPCIAACEAPFTSAEDVARAKGCAAQFQSYTDCLVDNGTCNDKSFDAPACGNEQAALTKCGTNASGGP